MLLLTLILMGLVTGSLIVAALFGLNGAALIGFTFGVPVLIVVMALRLAKTHGPRWKAERDAEREARRRAGKSNCPFLRSWF